MHEASHAGVGSSEASVVGASGFLGSTVVRSLRAAGVTVHEYTREHPALVGCRLAEGVATSSTIFWAATRINPYLAAKEPHLVEQDRRIFSSFVDAVAMANSGARVVLYSSGGTVYGDTGAPFAESSPVRPLNEYGMAKAELEKVLFDNLEHGTVVRVSNAYGPRQTAAPGQGVIGHWLRATLSGQPVRVFGDLETARDYIYVEDLTDALVRIHNRPAASNLLNLGSGRPTSLREVLEGISKVTGVPAPDVQLLPRREFDVQATWLDITRAKAELDWQPETPLEEGITRMWEWLTR